MGEKGNVAVPGSAGALDAATAGIESTVSTVGEIARTVAVGVGTTVATEAVQTRRAQTEDGGETDAEQPKD